MNDLLSKTFSVRTAGAYMEDLEAGGSAVEMATLAAEKSMESFRADSSAIEGDMEKIHELLRRLNSNNEESATATKAATIKELRDRMDRDKTEVLRLARIVKGRLEALNRANDESRKTPGCEAGSSVDRIRMSGTHVLLVNFKELMAQFDTLREKIMSEYRETIERRYYTITGSKAPEETIDQMIESGEGETFLKKAIQDQGKGHIMNTIMEIQERHASVKDIERSLLELHQIFLDMSTLVEAQGEQLNNIEGNVQRASSYVKHGTIELQKAKKLQLSSRKWTCIAIIILLIIIAIILAPTLTTLLPKN